MAKKIIISFLNQPATTGPGFDYYITVGGFELYYNSGVSDCKILFIPNGATPTYFNELAIGTTLTETIQITLDYLRNNFANQFVEYNIVNNTIEVTINADATVVQNPLLNIYLTFVVEDIEPSLTNLIYYLYFDDYVLNIYKENYLGASSEIFGSLALKKSAVETILEPIRGTGLELSLEANVNVTFEDFVTSNEFTYKTELLKAGQTVFEGYIKPDGIQQSYVNNEWIINIESNDALGSLKDLSFVQSNGLQFTGKMSIYDVIKGCLDRTRLSLDINTSVNIEYNGYTGTNILKDSYVNASRFIKDNQDSVLMNCNEVLTSMLNLFSGVITQQDGQWWICRPNDLILNGYTTFINQRTDVTFTKNLNAVLGSQINNFYPHHCDANQQIEVKGAISAYRLNYQYGFLDGFVPNSNLDHDAELIYENWTINESLPAGILLNSPSNTSGALMISKNQPDPFILTEVMTSTAFSTLEDTILTFRAKVSCHWLKHKFFFKIKTSDGYYLDKSNNWILGENSNTWVLVRCGENNFNTSILEMSYELVMPPVPNDCTISVVICRPFYDFFNDELQGLTEVHYVQILDNVFQSSGIVGEFHTVSRIEPPSSITKENQKVFNGDGGDILIGSIYKDDLLTPTDLWTRKDKIDNLPLLGISAMDDLRIQSNPVKVFSGNVFGQLPYLSVVTIDNVLGLFMFIEYDYDIKTNKSQVKLMQFYNSDLGDIYYEISPDFGNSTIKPTIKG